MNDMNEISTKTANAIRFYRATGKHDFLSNLFRRPIEFDEHPFPDDVDRREGKRVFRSSEDAYQYGKPRRREVAQWLIAAPSPHLCAMAAHGLFVYDIRSDWATFKLDRMRAVLEAKFGQHDDLRALLLATGDTMLIEESKMDAFWGIGQKGTGKNMLGHMLMEVREWCRAKPVA